MIDYKVCLNLGNEYIGANERTITANEDVKTCDEAALAREIAHENPLIPEQVAKAVLENFCKAAANLMSMGFAIQLKGGNDVALRIHPDIHVKGGNINLARAQELDPTVTELTVENAGDLVSRAGLTLRVKAECQARFTDMLATKGSGLHRSEVIERAKVERTDGGSDDPTPTPDPTPGPDEGISGNGSGNGNSSGGSNPPSGGNGDGDES